MNILNTIVIAMSMSADAFAVAAAKGAALRRVRFADSLRTGAVFGAVEMTLAAGGWCAGSVAGGYVMRMDHWLAFFILSALGVKMIAESFAGKKGCARLESHGLGALVLAAAGSSIDSLSIGATLAFIGSEIVFAAAAIGIATFVMSSLGVFLGNLSGVRIGKYAEAAGGCVLVFIGIKILAAHTGFL